MQAGASAGAARGEGIMQPSQNIGAVRRKLAQQALGVQRAKTRRTLPQATETRLLRELLDEAHARIRNLEKALERLTAAL
jgi:5-bromo-4-chloroindolyl phosphate hydrolysis protein